MTRVKVGPATTRRHKRMLKQTKGYELGRSKLFRLAKNAKMKAGLSAYNDRKVKKRTYRQLWVTRISAYLRSKGIRYGEFMSNVANSEIFLNRKILSNLCIKYPNVMDKIIESVK